MKVTNNTVLVKDNVSLACMLLKECVEFELIKQLVVACSGAFLYWKVIIIEHRMQKQLNLHKLPEVVQSTGMTHTQ